MQIKGNLLQVHAMVLFGPATGTLQRLAWFAKINYIIGGLQYSSNDMEHGVLRGNKPSPANPLSLIGLSQLAPLTFKRSDPRLAQASTAARYSASPHIDLSQDNSSMATSHGLRPSIS